METKRNDHASSDLTKHLVKLQQQGATGTLYIEAQINRKQKKNRVLVLQKGEITYAGASIPQPLEFARKLGEKFKPEIVKVALKTSEQKVFDKSSIRELFEIIIKMKVFTWEQVESYIHSRTLCILEQLLPFHCHLTFLPITNFDLSFGQDNHGLNIENLLEEINARKQQWQSLNDYIVSMEAVPFLPENSQDKITDENVSEHLHRYVNGKQSIVEIAQKLEKDSLQIARSYHNWAQMGWVIFPSAQLSKQPVSSIDQENNMTTADDKPITILAVDDNTVMQTMIKKTLGKLYNVLLASNALEGLKILDSKKVDLMLLDVTMPEIDGLQMCSKVRNTPKFKDLPIIMLTGKDTLVDKLKGQIAGTTHYLTKPFKKDEVVCLIDKYVVNKQESLN